MHIQHDFVGLMALTRVAGSTSKLLVLSKQ